MSFVNAILSKFGINYYDGNKKLNGYREPKSLNIAVITPTVSKEDYLASTILDGLSVLSKENNLFQFYISSECAERLSLKRRVLPRNEFIRFAKYADLILLIRKRKKYTDYRLADKIGRWGRTAFIDGSELRGNKRLDPKILKQLFEGDYQEEGAINYEMLTKCAFYFRREKPYPAGVIPLPYGIESSYSKHYKGDRKKDIDFACIWGQEDCPPLRRDVREKIEVFCRDNGFIYRTERTKDSNEFYEILSRTKVGISVSGGGFDTARFWEILGNNCLLLTEKIDVYRPEDNAFDYQRIWEFEGIRDFEVALNKIAHYLRTGYNSKDLEWEFKEILSRHSSKARVLTIIEKAKEKNLFKRLSI